MRKKTLLTILMISFSVNVLANFTTYLLLHYFDHLYYTRQVEYILFMNLIFFLIFFIRIKKHIKLIVEEKRRKVFNLIFVANVILSIYTFLVFINNLIAGSSTPY